jgi:hypothetical protein
VAERDGNAEPALLLSRLEEVHAVTANAIPKPIPVRNILREHRDGALFRTLSSSTRIIVVADGVLTVGRPYRRTDLEPNHEGVADPLGVMACFYRVSSRMETMPKVRPVSRVRRRLRQPHPGREPEEGAPHPRRGGRGIQRGTVRRYSA